MTRGSHTDRAGGFRTALGLSLAVAVLLGVAAAGGSLVRGTGNTATAGQAFPYALMGALAGGVLVGIVGVAIRLARPGLLKLRPLEWLAIVFLAAALGALIGAALTPKQPRPDEVSPLEQDEIDRRREQAGEFSDRTRVGTVDRDGDGRPDVDANGEPIIAYDLDGDGRLDGYLQRCPDSTPVPERRPGYFAIDEECDGTVERWVPFDPDRFLTSDGTLQPPADAGPPDTISPRERRERAQDAGPDGRRGAVFRNVLLILLAIAVAAIIVTVLVRLPDRHRSDGDAESESDDDPDDGSPPSPGVDLSASFEASLDTMLQDPDPRQGICAAYGRLLEGLAEAGLGRRPEEAPEEHVMRCLATARIAEQPSRELVALFSLARFSPHPIEEHHRVAAVRAMRSALASRAPAPTAPTASATPAPVGGPPLPPPPST